MKIKTLIVVLLVLLTSATFSQQMVLRFEHITSEDGLLKNVVHGIMQDKYGFMWIGTWSGLCRYDGNKFIIYQTNSSDSNSIPGNRVESLYKDKEGNIWVGFKEDACRYNYETNNFTRFSLTKIPKNIRDSLNRFTSIFYTYIKTNDLIWQVNQFESPLVKHLPSSEINNLLTQTNRHTGKQIIYRNDPLNHMSLNSEYVYNIYLDDNQLLWVGTSTGGINFADTKRRLIDNYYQTQQNDNSIIDNLVRAIYVDKQGNLWVGTQTKGITKIEQKTNKYTHYQFNEKDPDHSLINDQVRNIYCDRYGYMWFGTKGGLDKFDPKTNRHTHYTTTSKNKIPDNWVYQIMEDHLGYLWITTFNGIAKYDRKNDTFIAYAINYTAASSRVRLILEDHKNNLWVATDGGGIARLKRTTLSDNEEKISIDRVFLNSLIDSNSLSGNYVYSMLEDKNGIFWIGTSAGLNCLDPQKGVFKRYNEKNNLPNDMILGILDDHNGNIWLSHKKGICKININTLEVNNFTKEDGLQDNEFSENAFFRNEKSGKLYFGGINGLSAFFPEVLIHDTNPPKTYITNLKIQNQSIKINQIVNGRIILNKPIYLTKEITIKYIDKIITLEFAGLHYTNPKNNKYAYQLEGFDKNWVFTDASMRIAQYSNLEPGTYIFKVKSSNCDGYWNSNPTILKIIVLPPWWKTWYFRVFILLSIIGLSLGFYYYRVARLRKQQIYLKNLVKERTKEIEGKNVKLLEQTLELNETNTLLEERQQQIEEQSERLENMNAELLEKNKQLEQQTTDLNETNTLLEERQQFIEEQSEELLSQKEVLEKLNDDLNELNATKDKFFSIIAHDIKNPFSTIIGFSELLELYYNEWSDEKKLKIINVIFTSSKNLYQLLENLLQWSRSQRGIIEFNPEKIELKEMIINVIDLLKDSADRKNIKLIHNIPDKGITVYADKQMLNTILRNLISNAIKFTNLGGKIFISAELDSINTTIKVIDNGVGISEDNIENIFKIDAHHSTPGTESEKGTGLGLILSKEFISKHNGEIGVESTPGKGSTFYFTLPLPK